MGTPDDFTCQVTTIVSETYRHVETLPNGVWRLWLPGYDLRRDSSNVLLTKHWSVRRRRSRMADDVVFMRGRAARLLPPPAGWDARGPFRVHVVRAMGSRAREMDRDNAVGACKFLIDALVSNGVLAGDGTKVLPFAPVVEQVRNGSAGVLLCLHRLGGGDGSCGQTDLPGQGVRP